MRLVFIVLGSFFIFLAGGCVSHSQLLNYQDDVQGLQDTIQITTPPEIRIQPNDVLSIKVFSSNMETAAPFNLAPGNQGDNFFSIETIQLNGYLVDPQGMIDFPVLGTMHLRGMTISETREMIKEKLRQHIKDPVVNIRLLNFTVTVTGEVGNPGKFTVVNERISLPDALALAGDLTGYANRRNILIVREKDGYLNRTRVDLHSAEFFKSEYYYLKQNDMIYVEPLRSKTGDLQDQTSKTVPVIGLAATLIAIIVGLVN